MIHSFLKKRMSEKLEFKNLYKTFTCKNENKKKIILQNIFYSEHYKSTTLIKLSYDMLDYYVKLSYYLILDWSRVAVIWNYLSVCLSPKA